MIKRDKTLSNLTYADTYVWHNCLDQVRKLFDDGWDIHGNVFPITGWLYVLKMKAEESLVRGVSCSVSSFVLRDQD